MLEYLLFLSSSFTVFFLPPRREALPVNSQEKGSNPTALYAEGVLRGDIVKLVTGSPSAPILGEGVMF